LQGSATARAYRPGEALVTAVEKEVAHTIAHTHTHTFTASLWICDLSLVVRSAVWLRLFSPSWCCLVAAGAAGNGRAHDATR
jgi:hypothetical protein